jgi:hypothetical protein
VPLTRVYLALTPDDLAALAQGRPLGPPLHAHAVTPSLGRPGLATDEEELEHLAWLAASEEAVGRSAARALRRVVASADVDAATVVTPTAPDTASRVELSAPVDLRRVVSFHVDEEPGATEPTDLLWYDVTELSDVRALVAEE